MGAIENIGAAAKKYVDAYNKVEERRRVWQEVTKSSVKVNLYYLFTTYAVEIGDWTLLTHDEVTALKLGAVSLTLTPQVNDSELDAPPFNAIGTLNYEQKVNGQVSVYATLQPTVNFRNSEQFKVIETNAPVELGTYEPASLDAEEIGKHVLRFIELVTDFYSK